MTKKKPFPKAVLLIPAAVLLAASAKFLYFNVTPSGLIGFNNYKNILGEKVTCNVSPSGCFKLPCFSKICIITNPASVSVSESSGDEMANWKTYTNDSLGIYFKYPHDYSLKQTSAEQTILSLEGPDKSSFLLVIYENPQNLSLKDYENQNTGESGMGPSVYYSNAELVKFQNIEAYYEKEEIRCFSKCGSYIWTSKGKIYKLQGSGKQVLDQILSTFKFTE